MTFIMNLTFAWNPNVAIGITINLAIYPESDFEDDLEDNNMTITLH